MTPSDYPDESATGPGGAAIAQADLPPAPDFARFIPVSSIEQAKQQQAAEEWGRVQQQKIADMWGQYAQQQLDDTVQQSTQMSWQPATPTVMNAPEPAAQQPPEVNPVTAEPTTNPLIDQFLSGLGGIVDRIKGAAVQPGPGAGVDESSPLGPAANPQQAPAGNIGAAGLAAMQAEIPGTGAPVEEGGAPGEPSNISPLGPPQGTPNQTVASELGNLAQAGLSAADVVPAIESGVTRAALATGNSGLSKAALEMRGVPAIAGAGEGMAPVARTALTADHPIVQAVVDASQQAGAKVNAGAVAKLIQSKGFSPENLAKATGRLNPTQTAALAAVKAADDPELASALIQASDEAMFAPKAGTGAIDLPTPAASEPDVANLAEAGTKSPQDVVDLPPYTGAGHSVLADTPAIRGLNAIQGTLKQAVLAGSVFHPIVETAQLGRTALAEGAPVAGAQGIAASMRAFADSGFAQRFAEQHAADIADAEKAGMTMARIGGSLSPDVQQMGNRIARTVLSSAGSGVAGYASAKAQGQSDEDALKRGAVFAAGGAGVAQLAPALNAAMWGRMIPVAKLTAFNIMKDTYGPEVAATRANNIFGGQNLAKLGRNPEVQTILKSTFLAPDWLESWARNLGAVVKPGPEGAAARKWWAATGVSSALTLEGLNMALTGHPTTDNEQGRALQLEVTPIVHAMGGDPNKRYYADVLELGPLGSMLQAGARGGIGAVGKNLAAGHLNVVPDIGLSAVQNFAPTGGQIVSQGTPAEKAVLPEVAAAAGHIAPIGMSSFEKPDIPVSAGMASGATGVRIAAGPAGVQKKAAANPMAPPSAATAKNVSNLRSFLTGPAPKGRNPMAPAGAGSNVSNLRALK